MAKRVSSIYGDALFELAIEEERVDDFYEEVKGIAQILEENKELLSLLAHPEINKEEKIAIVKDVFTGNVSEEITGFLCIIVEKDRYNDIPAILAHFIERAKEYKKIGTASVTSATELSSVQKKKLEQRLLETTRYTSFEVEYHVDPSILGGLVIRIRNRVMDSSLKTQIEKLGKGLSKISLS
ncbi:MAG: F0F1 ATP synthase subunit delta [Eubacterium sp.]|nr:F0F1 ATP synthase subunit delta [Eubacterium sp.]MDD7210618.1 ATP synthase F1 subunit delta [Lachnospiraceae bacterium]MDY5498085.1 ATP synthase F1 subunit delta [Anaerobutyricum sp.]